MIKDIPIYIVSFNRLDCLKKQIAFLDKCDLKNIHIIDNASTYKPLLDYLKSTSHKVYLLDKNYGHEVLFKCAKFKDVIDNKYFVLTDPDIIPVEECPNNFLHVFHDILQNNPTINKVGFSLKIDDLPACYPLKDKVIKWEKQFYQYPTNYKDILIFSAPIDTTFALYRPRKKWRSKNFYSAIRVGHPYAARHLPWYKDLKKMNDEDSFYNSLDVGVGNWNGNSNFEKLFSKFIGKERRRFDIYLFFLIPIVTFKQKDNIFRIKIFNFVPIGKITVSRVHSGC